MFDDANLNFLYPDPFLTTFSSLETGISVVYLPYPIGLRLAVYHHDRVSVMLPSLEFQSRCPHLGF